LGREGEGGDGKRREEMGRKGRGKEERGGENGRVVQF